MEVLFLKNPDTGEVRRFFVQPATENAGQSFYGWEVVDAEAWIEANADHELVQAALERRKQKRENDDRG